MNLLPKKTRFVAVSFDRQSRVPRPELDLVRELWAELHAKKDPTPEWFESWILRVPQFTCSCREDFRNYLKTNPARYDDWYSWSVEAHNYVNQKLGKPIWIGDA